jgi:hypothetical protein
MDQGGVLLANTCGGKKVVGGLPGEETLAVKNDDVPEQGQIDAM